MSLSDETKRSLLNPSTNTAGFMKIIYYKFPDDDSLDVTKLIGKNNEKFDNSIFENIGSSDEVERIFSEKFKDKNFINAHELPTIKYIFVGTNPDDVKLELDRISKNVIEKKPIYDGVNTSQLALKLGFLDADQLIKDFNIASENEVVFTDKFLSVSNNFNTVSQIVSNHLNNITETEICSPESLFIFGEKTNKAVEDMYTNLKYNIIKKFKQNESEYSIHNLISTLTTYLVPLRVIEYFINLYGDNVTSSIHKLLNNYVIRRYICLYLKYNNIGHDYTTKTGSNYPIDSNIGYYFHKIDNQSEIYSEPLQLKNIKISTIKKLDSIEDTLVDNNTLHIYNYYNIERHLIKNKSINVSQKKQFYQNFVLKYFPSLKVENILNNSPEFIETIRRQSLDANNVIQNYTNINDVLFKFNQQSMSNLDITIKNQYLINIRKNINLPSNFDFRNIFNDLTLTSKIPFVKFRDIYGTKDVIYKIFKPSTEKLSEKHVSEITRDKLDEWVKFKGYEFQGNDLKKIKAHPKYISYKYKFSKIKKSNPIKGRIYVVNRDSTYDIITDTGMIYNNISGENIINEGMVFSVETNVSFYKNEYIYADIDIFRKEYLDFNLDLRVIPELSREIFEKIKNSITDFINTLFSTESLKRYKSINDNTDKEYLVKSQDNHITNLIYNYDVKLNKTFKLDYKTLEQVGYILHPFVLVKDDLFPVSTPIEFYDIDNSQWINGIIKKINIDFTYDLQLNDPSKKVTTMVTKENVSKIYIRLRGGKTNRVFKLNYKQISGFDEMSPINSYLNKLNTVGLDSNSQVKKLMDTFLIEKEKAIRLVSSYVENSDNSKKTSGIDITIDYTKMLYDPNETNILVTIENVNSFSQVRHVKRFINLFFETSLVISKYVESNKIITRILTSEIMDKDGNIDTEKIKQNIEKSETTIEKVAENVLEVDDDEFSDIEDEDDDLFDDSDEELIEEEIEEIEELIEEEAEEPEKRVIDELLTDAKLSKGSNKLHSSMVLNKLKLRDPKLFDWSKEGTQATGYSRTCQAGRQPQVLTDLEKQEIDNDFDKISKDWSNEDNENPLSPYSANDIDKEGNIIEYIDCDQNTVKSMKDNQQCKSLKWGSASDSSLHNWYICPKIFDLNANKPIHVKELKFKRTDVKFKPSKGITSAWRTHSDTNPELDGLDILDFKPYYEKDGAEYYPWIKSASDPEPTIYKSLLFAAKKEQDGLTPGLKGKSQHPEGYFMPCCFKKSMNIKNAFRVGTDKVDVRTNYIQNWGHGLGEGKYGLLNKIMNKYFYNTNPKPMEKKSAETGLIRDNKGCFMRYGIENSYDNVFRLFSELYKLDQSIIVNRILTRLTVNNFKNLNRGDLTNHFTFKGIQSSYQNFLEYVLSSQFKKLEFFIELLSNKKYNIVDRNINIVVLEIDYSNNSLEVICPNYYDYKETDSLDVAFLLKTNSGHFELLCKFDVAYDQPNFIFNQNDLINSHSNLSRIFDELSKEGKCYLKNKSQLELDNNIIGLITNDDIKTIIDKIQNDLSDKFVINAIIHDEYNKTIGILLSNGVTIPIYPQNFKSEFDIKKNIDIEPIDYSVLKDSYSLINQHLEYEKEIKIIDHYSSSDNKYIITNTGNYIKVNSLPDTSKVSSLVKTDYFKVDQELSKYHDITKKDIYKSALDIESVRDILDKIENIRITDILMNQNHTVYALLVRNSIGHKLIIPIKVISEDDIKTYINEAGVTVKTNFEIDLDINIYMDSIVQLSRLSFYKIPCVPIRGLFSDMLNDKKYSKVILETGLVVDLKDSKKFNIWDIDRSGKFVINELIDTPIIDKLYFTSSSNIPLELVNNRIINNIRINYNLAVNEIIKNKIYEIFQQDKFADIKTFIQSVIKNPILKKSSKKLLTRGVMRIIFSVLTKVVSEDMANFKDINEKIKCDSTNCHNAFCINEPINLEEYKSLSDIDILKLSIIPLESDKTEEISEEDIKKVSKTIDESLINKMTTSFKDIILIFSDMDNLCKIKININNVNDQTQFNKIKNKIFNEMLFNKYRSYELFNYINKNISDEDLNLDPDNEFIFMSSEYTMSTLNQLYIKSLNKYYNEILPFDKSIQRISSIPLKERQFNLTKECILSSKINVFEIDTLKCGIYPKKNNSQLKTNPLHKKLDSNQIKDIKDLLDSL